MTSLPTPTSRSAFVISSASVSIGKNMTHSKGGGALAHPEIALMFRAWLFTEFMLVSSIKGISMKYDISKIEI